MFPSLKVNSQTGRLPKHHKLNCCSPWRMLANGSRETAACKLTLTEEALTSNMSEVLPPQEGEKEEIMSEM